MIYVNTNKLNNINLVSNNFYVVMDFDSTITTSTSSGSWGVLENTNFMNPNFKRDSHKLFEKYYPYELDYSLDNEIKSKYIEEWYIKNMDLFYTYNLTYEILLACTKNSNVEFRSGVKDFLKNLYENKIPVIILSAGIGNVIVELLKLNECYFDNIFITSNFINFENNKILPFEDKIIHTSNKSIDKLPIEVRNKLKNKDYILLFGDLIEDLNMVHEDDLKKTLSFGFLEKNIDKNLELYKNSFDVVLTCNSSFEDVKKILNSLKND